MTSINQAKLRRGPDGSYLDPIGESIFVTDVPWSYKVDPSSIFCCNHIVRCYRIDCGMDTGTPKLTDSDVLPTVVPRTVGAGEVDECRLLSDTLRNLEADKETLSANISSIYTDWVGCGTKMRH